MITKNKHDIHIVDSRIFAYCKPFAFAWAFGRLLIMNENQELVDFGDGGMSRAIFGHHSGKFKHNVLGNMEGDDTVFKFYDYNIEFDFLSLRNCAWLDKNKVKGKGLYESPILFHLKRYSKKRS